MRRRDAIRIPNALKPLLERPSDWPEATWRVTSAACRASGFVAWAARLERADGEEEWLEGRSPSRPAIVQSECVDALLAALEKIPPGAAVEVIAPTSLRYLVEGEAFPDAAPERCLFDMASRRRIWARYALGELEAPVAECLVRAYASLAPLRWPGEAAVQDGFVLYADGGCTAAACASAWVLRRNGATVRDRAWRLDGTVERDGVRLAEFTAAADGLAAVPRGANVALVTDHADVTDFGVRGVPAFRPSSRLAPTLQDLLRRAAERSVRWYWAARDETEGQRRCQALIDRQLAVVDALVRFMSAAKAAGLRRLFAPDFDYWLASREPILGQPGDQWSATFERRDRYVEAEPNSRRVFVREILLARGRGQSAADAFARSKAASWCEQLTPSRPLAGSVATLVGRTRSQFDLVVLLFEPDVAVLVQARPGASAKDVRDAASHVRELTLS